MIKHLLLSIRFKIFLLLLLGWTSDVFAQKLLLSQSGKSKYVITVPPDANTNELKAANEFRKYFKAITNFTLAIRQDDFFNRRKFAIQISEAKRSTSLPILSANSVLIKTNRDNLIITGAKGRDVLYAVYTFFEEYLNCRFYALDEVVIPKRDTIEIAAINYGYTPPFTFRSYYSLENMDKSYADFQKQTYFFENRLYYAHSFAWLLPASKYFQSNPEFFALINGKRDASQMCFSSRGALAELIRVLKLEMKASPDNQVWSVSTLDSPNICHCSLCEPIYRSGSGFTETLMPFVNEIARTFPNKTISTLAYNQSILPSVRVKPERNVEIMFCFTNVDRRYALNDVRNIPAKKYNDALTLWRAQTDDLFIWDYAVNYFHSLSPFPNSQTFQKNLIYFEQMGIRKVFLQGIGPQRGEFSELKSYLGSKLLWNPNADSEKIKDEFLKNYYGNAWPDVKTYLNALETQSKNYSISLNEYAGPTQYAGGFLNVSNRNTYRNILERALSKVKSQKKYYERVNKELLALRYADLEIESRTANDATLFNKKLHIFETDAKQLKIKNLRNGELTVDEFVKMKAK